MAYAPESCNKFMAPVSGACVIGFRDEWAELYQFVRHRASIGA